MISTPFVPPSTPSPPPESTIICILTCPPPQLDDKLPTLEEQGIPQLTSASITSPVPLPEPIPTSKHLDRAFQLKRLSKSLLLNFLELLGIMSVDPEQALQKIEALRTLFINFHHVLNEYRPHQARESLIALMQDRLDKTRAETQAVRAAVDRARREIEGLASITLPEREVEEAEKDEEEEGARSREVDTWREVDAAF